MENLKKCRVFIASPSDIVKERKAFNKLLEKVNKQNHGIHFVPRSSKTVLPGLGSSSQGVIDPEVEKCDIFVMLLWHKWGTPVSERYSSGTYKEYCQARRRADKRGRKTPRILLYFRESDKSQILDPGEQFKKVQEFKKRIEKEGKLLYSHYKTVTEWKELFENHLCRWLNDELPRGTAASLKPSIPPDTVGATLDALEKELAEEKKRRQSVEGKLKVRALKLAEDAWKAARDGRLTEAEEKFAHSLEDYRSPTTLTLYGHYLLQIGNLQYAERAYKEVRDTCIASKNRQGSAAAYGNLGNIYQTRGDLARAEKMHKKSLKLDRELGSKEGMANQYGNLGNVYRIRGDLDRAEEMLKKSVTL